MAILLRLLYRSFGLRLRAICPSLGIGVIPVLLRGAKETGTFSYFTFLYQCGVYLSILIYIATVGKLTVAST